MRGVLVVRIDEGRSLAMCQILIGQQAGQLLSLLGVLLGLFKGLVESICFYLNRRFVHL